MYFGYVMAMRGANKAISSDDVLAAHTNNFRTVDLELNGRLEEAAARIGGEMTEFIHSLSQELQSAGALEQSSDAQLPHSQATDFGHERVLNEVATTSDIKQDTTSMNTMHNESMLHSSPIDLEDELFQLGLGSQNNPIDAGNSSWTEVIALDDVAPSLGEGSWTQAVLNDVAYVIKSDGQSVAFDSDVSDTMNLSDSTGSPFDNIDDITW